uniref:Uncharacterized protein n=1 Tax=Arundo donax TaxID=35708 RepID=A0A0A8ZXJ8_ARUDO
MNATLVIFVSICTWISSRHLLNEVLRKQHALPLMINNLLIIGVTPIICQNYSL